VLTVYPHLLFPVEKKKLGAGIEREELFMSSRPSWPSRSLLSLMERSPDPHDEGSGGRAPHKTGSSEICPWTGRSPSLSLSEREDMSERSFGFFSFQEKITIT